MTTTGHRRHKKLFFIPSFPRNISVLMEQQCKATGLEHLLFKHCSQGQFTPSISKFHIGYQGFHHTHEKKHSQCLGLVLIFPVIPKCSGLNFHWCQLNSISWRGKHLWQIIIYWSKSTGGARHWLHGGTEWCLGAGEDVLLIKCRKRTEKIFS